MTYRTKYDPELYEEFEHVREKAILLEPGESFDLTVKEGVYMAQQRIRELFRFTQEKDPTFVSRSFTVRVNKDTNTITVVKKGVRNFGVEMKP